MFAVVLIVGVCIARDFHHTVFYEGKVIASVSNITDYINMGAVPLGYFSIGAAVLSVMSGRLAAKQNNFGNVLGMIIAITSGTLDYLFGNHSAIVTYPVTFLVATFATYKWSTGIKIRSIDILYFFLTLMSFVVGFSLVFLGFNLFGGDTRISFQVIVSLIFSLSLAGNITGAFKYKETWVNWLTYNVLQLTKNYMYANFANVVKYIFYICNSGISYLDWKWNGDITKNSAIQESSL